MNSLIAIRKQMGWTQTDLALYLGVTRGMVSMAEINKRELPSGALVKESQLSRLLATKPKTSRAGDKATKVLSALDTKAKDTLKKARKYAAAELKQTRELLAEMEENYKEAEHQLKLLPRLENLMSEQKNPAGSVLTGMGEQKILKRLKDNSPEKQMDLKLKIAALDARAHKKV